LWSFREKQRFCWQKNILLSFSIAFMCYNPKIVLIELSLSYLSRCGSLRAGIFGVSGRNKGSADRKIFFLSFSKAFMCHDSKIVIIELSLSYLSRCGPLRAGRCGVSGRNKGSAGRKIFFCPST
jgi:hypothetical protein